MSTDVRVAHINVHQPANDATRRYNIDGVVNYVLAGGVGTLNEIGKPADHAYIASLRDKGVNSYVYGELGVLWNTQRFARVSATQYRIMVGGHVGADGGPGGDSRRVGPSRFVVVVVLQERSTGIKFQVCVTHLVAKADTSAKWRQGIRAASIRVAGLRISALNKQYPNGLLNGDMNFAGPRLDFPYLAEIQLPLLRTMGGMHYDRGFVWGETKLVGSMETFTRRSDHLGFVYTVRIGDGVSVDVPPVSNVGTGRVVVKPVPKPKPAPKHFPGAPVKHPWASKSRSWKRRHGRLWRKIVIWRKHHKR